MRNSISLALLFCLFSATSWGDAVVTLDGASDIATDTSGFNGNLSATDDNVQDALDTLDNISLAPTGAEFIVGAAHAGLSAERVCTDTTTIDCDMGTAAQAKLNVQADSIDSTYLADTDFGDFTCADGAGGCTIDADSIALGTDTTGNYAGSASEGGAATTATALAANGADCSAGSYPLGVDASGAAESCTDATTEIDSAIATHVADITSVHGLNIVNTPAAGDLLIRNAGNTAFEDVPMSGDATIASTGAVTVANDSHDHTTTISGKAANVSDADFGDVTVSSGAWAVENDSHNHSATTLDTDSVSADELNATGVEAELEAVLDIAGDVTGTGMSSVAITADVIDFADILYTNTLAGNPALGVDECWILSTATGGGFICEGSTADTAEQLYLFPDLNGSDTTKRIMVDDTEISAIDDASLEVSSGTLRRAALTGDVTASAGSNTTVIADSVTVTGWELGASTATTPAENDNDTSIATTAYVQTEIASISSGGASPNLLINPSFSVAQRGTSFTSATTIVNSDDTYLLDRWVLLSDGNDIVDVTQQTSTSDTGDTSYIRLDVETAEKKFGILQVIENKNCKHIIGETATLSFKARVTGTAFSDIRAGVISWSSTSDTVTSDVISAWNAEDSNPTLVANWTFENTPASQALSTSWTTYTITNISIDTASTTNVGVLIWSDDTDTTVGEFLEITQIKLEAGASATTFQEPSFGEELEKSHRYFWKTFAYATAPAQSAGTGGTISFRTGLVGVVNASEYVWFPVSMRTAGTRVWYNPSAANGNWRNETDVGDSGAGGVTRAGENGLGAAVTQVATDGAGDQLSIHLTVDSEL